MLTATHIPAVRFAAKVGVAPSTTTLQFDGPPTDAGSLGVQCLPEPVRPWPPVMPPPKPSPPQPKPPGRFYVLYGSNNGLSVAYDPAVERVQPLPHVPHAGLGLITETDAWLTGRPYGLPGTTALRLREDDGHWSAGLVGAELGQDVGELTEVVRQFLEVEKAQQSSLERIAFWTALTGGITVGAVVLSLAVGVAAAGRQVQKAKAK